MIKNTIRLTTEQRKELVEFSTTGVHDVRLVNRAKIILESDASGGKEPIKQGEAGKKFNISEPSVCKIRREFRESESVSAFLERKKRLTPSIEPKITGEVEAHIIALACGEAPNGCAKWTLQLLANKCVELNIIDSISNMSVHRLLKKHNLSLT